MPLTGKELDPRKRFICCRKRFPFVNISTSRTKNNNNRMQALGIGAFAGVDPFGVDVDGLAEVVGVGLEVLQADAALNVGAISLAVHLHLARLFVIAERTIEERVQRLDRLLGRLGLSITFLLSHRRANW